MKGNLNRILLVLVLVALAINIVLQLRTSGDDAANFVWTAAYLLTLAADLVLAVFGLLVTTRALRKKEKGSLTWARWAFGGALVTTLLIAAAPFLPGVQDLHHMMQNAAGGLFLTGIPLSLFAYAFHREHLRLGSGRHASRRSRNRSLPDDGE